MWGVCKLGSGVNVGNVNLGQHRHFFMNSFLHNLSFFLRKASQIHSFVTEGNFNCEDGSAFPGRLAIRLHCLITFEVPLPDYLSTSFIPLANYHCSNAPLPNYLSKVDSFQVNNPITSQ